MPANLTPEYRAAEQQLMQAKTPAEKLEALRLMLSRMPKHKGTDKLQADLKRRIARANEEIQSQAKQKRFAIHVEREGAAQVAIIGPPNAGKSRLVSALTGVALEVAPYPFTTQRPVPAMMPYEDVQIQLVDLPPVSAAHTESWVFGMVRIADAALLVVDLSSADVLDQIEEVLTTLERSKLKLVREAVEADPSASVASKQCWLVGTKLDLPVRPAAIAKSWRSCTGSASASAPCRPKVARACSRCARRSSGCCGSCGSTRNRRTNPPT